MIHIAKSGRANYSRPSSISKVFFYRITSIVSRNYSHVLLPYDSMYDLNSRKFISFIMVNIKKYGV